MRDPNLKQFDKEQLTLIRTIAGERLRVTIDWMERHKGPAHESTEKWRQRATHRAKLERLIIATNELLFEEREAERAQRSRS